MAKGSIVTLADYMSERETLAKIIQTREEATERYKTRLAEVNRIIEGLEPTSNIVELKKDEKDRKSVV